MERGEYVVIEGQDKTGKTTQANMLGSKLAEIGINSIVFEEPKSEMSPITEGITSILKNGNIDKDPLTQMLLFSAARCEMWRNVGRKALAKGDWVISSRNYLSTHAYQGFGFGVNRELIDTVTKISTNDTIQILPNIVLADHAEFVKNIKKNEAFFAINKLIDSTEVPKHLMTQNLLYLAARSEAVRVIGRLSTATFFEDQLLKSYFENSSQPDSDYMLPDHKFMLLIDEEERKRRLLIDSEKLENPDTFESQPDSFQDRVSGAYVEIAKEKNMTVIFADKNRSREKISDEIWDNILL